jgi:hypothetical protein
LKVFTNGSAGIKRNGKGLLQTSKRSPALKSLISDSAEFVFGATDISSLRKEMKNTFEKISEMYLDWKERNHDLSETLLVEDAEEESSKSKTLAEGAHYLALHVLAVDIVLYSPLFIPCPLFNRATQEAFADQGCPPGEVRASWSALFRRSN